MDGVRTRVSGATDLEEGWPPGAWPGLLTLGAGAFAIGTDLFVMAGILGDLAGDLDVTIGAAGSTVTVFALAYALGAPLLSALLGARPLRTVLIGSLVLFGGFNLASALAPSLWLLLGARVLSALAAGVFVPAAGAAAVAAVPASHRGRALAVVLAGSSTAMLLGAPLGVLATAASSWRAAFGLVAVLAALTAVGLLLGSVGSRSGSGGLGSGAAEPGAASVRDRLRPLRSPAVVGTLGVTLLVMAGSNAMYTYLDVLVGPAVGPIGIGLVIAVFGAGGLAGTWWGGTAADRGAPVLPVVAGALIAAFALSPMLAATVAGALALVAVWGVAAFACVPAQQHRLLGIDAGPAPLVLALNSSAVHLGFAGGALLGGLLVDAAGAGPLWMLAVACSGAGLTVHGLLGRRGRAQFAG